jgi:hypothetical protein
MDDELALLVRAVYSDTSKVHGNTRYAFNQAVELVKQSRPELPEHEARKRTAVALAVEPRVGAI